MSEPADQLEALASLESEGVRFGREVHELIEGAKELGKIDDIHGGGSEVRVNGLPVYRTTPLVFNEGGNTPRAGERRQALLGNTLLLTEEDQPDGAVTFSIDVYEGTSRLSLDAPPPLGITRRIITTGTRLNPPNPQCVTIHREQEIKSKRLGGKEVKINEWPTIHEQAEGTRQYIREKLEPQLKANQLFQKATTAIFKPKQ